MTTEVQATKKKLEQLNNILDAANSEAKRWGQARGYDIDYDSTDKEYVEYRESCYKKVEFVWWRIAKSIGIDYPPDYRTFESVEQKMKSCLSDYEYNNPDWLLDVFEEIGEE